MCRKGQYGMREIIAVCRHWSGPPLARRTTCSGRRVELALPLAMRASATPTKTCAAHAAGPNLRN